MCTFVIHHIKNYDENMIMITVVSKHYHYMMKSSGIIRNCDSID